MFDDFNVDDIEKDAKDTFNSVSSHCNSAIADLKKYKHKAVGLLDEASGAINGVHDTVDGFIDATRDTVHDLGDPFGIVDGFVDSYLNAAEGLVDDAFSVVDQLLGTIKPTPYQKVCKQHIKKLVDTPFRQGWQWVVEADHTPPDFDIYIKDLDLGLGSVDADTQAIGSGAIAKPTTASAGEITMTIRDHQDGRVLKWFRDRLGQVRNQDGTVNLPVDYVFEIRVKMVDENGNISPWKKYRVFATGISTTLNYESQSEFINYSITLQKWSSVGNKFL